MSKLTCLVTVKSPEHTLVHALPVSIDSEGQLVQLGPQLDQALNYGRGPKIHISKTVIEATFQWVDTTDTHLLALKMSRLCTPKSA